MSSHFGLIVSFGCKLDVGYVWSDLNLKYYCFQYWCFFFPSQRKMDVQVDHLILMKLWYKDFTCRYFVVTIPRFWVSSHMYSIFYCIWGYFRYSMSNESLFICKLMKDFPDADNCAKIMNVSLVRTNILFAGMVNLMVPLIFPIKLICRYFYRFKIRNLNGLTLWG